MPKRNRTFRTFWEATRSTRRSSIAALIAATCSWSALVPARAQTPSLAGILSARKAALVALHVHSVAALEIEGSIGSGQILGSFHRWQKGEDARQDDELASHAVRSLRLGDREYVINESGDVRELRGVLAKRQRTQDFIASGDFIAKSPYDTLKGTIQLPDGRSAYVIEVNPPDGQPETIYLDEQSLMIDRIGYDDDDGVSTEDYYGYEVYHGALVSRREVDSNGDHAFDVTHFVRAVSVGAPIDSAVFALPASSVVQTDKAVTVPIREEAGHLYAQVRVGTKDYKFLVDTGAQMIALDSHVASEQGLARQGRLEVAGARRIGGLGFAQLDSISLGGVSIPVRSVSVLDLHDATNGADGVLGYPFFAAAEVTIDSVARTMTFGKPGTLRPQGSEFSVDTDRQLIEMKGTVNRVDGTFVVDTGNSTELLLYSPFMNAHPEVVPLEDRQRAASDYGVGGTARASFAYIDVLAFGPFNLFNQFANVIMSDTGAFADRFDAGNIGMGVIKNFIVTFDEANGKIYAAKSAAFDDGRYRRRLQDPGVMFQ